MKSLYESLLDADIIDKLDSNIYKLWDLNVSGSGKNAEVTFFTFDVNDDGDLIPYKIGQNRNDTPTIYQLFPNGVKITILAPGAEMKINNRSTKIKLSELAKHNITANTFSAYDCDDLKMVDYKCDSVILAAGCFAKPSMSIQNMFDYCAKYTNNLLFNFNPISDDYNYTPVLSIKNCKMHNIFIREGAPLFGLYSVTSHNVDITQFLKRHVDVYGSPQGSRDDVPDPQKSKFAIQVKEWIKNNPKTNLFLSWTGYKNYLNYEHMLIKGRRLTAE